MRTAEELVKKWVHDGGTTYLAVDMLRDYGEEVRAQAIAMINEARCKGEHDIRTVRTMIEKMSLP